MSFVYVLGGGDSDQSFPQAFNLIVQTLNLTLIRIDQPPHRRLRSVYLFHRGYLDS